MSECQFLRQIRSSHLRLSWWPRRASTTYLSRRTGSTWHNCLLSNFQRGTRLLQFSRISDKIRVPSVHQSIPLTPITAKFVSNIKTFYILTVCIFILEYVILEVPSRWPSMLQKLQNSDSSWTIGFNHGHCPGLPWTRDYRAPRWGSRGSLWRSAPAPSS